MLKRIIGTSLVAAFLAMGASAFADHHEQKAFNAGTELRGEFGYNFQGFLEGETNDVNDEPTAQLGFTGIAKLVFSGNIGSKTKYFLRYSLYDGIYNTHDNPIWGGIEAANITYHMSNMIHVRAGNNYVNLGGFEQKARQYDAMFLSTWLQNAAALGLTTPSFDLLLNTGAGKVTLQLTNEKFTSGATKAEQARFATRSNANNDHSNSQISALLEWHGKFGAIQPLLQYQLTDLGKRHAFTAGLGFKDRNSGLNLAVDFSMDFLADKNDNPEDGETWMNVAINAGMNVDRFMPFVKFAWTDVKQNGTDLEGNTTVPAIGATTVSGIDAAFDDNKIEWAVGSHMRMDGNAFKPYIAIHGEHAKFTVAGEEESKSNLDIKLGVMSKF